MSSPGSATALPELFKGKKAMQMGDPNVRIFVDFWNFQLALKDFSGPEYRLDWSKLAGWLTGEASTLTQQVLRCDGLNVYLSCNPRSDKDKKLMNWATNVLDRFPGVKVVVKERKAKAPPVCPNCHGMVRVCPHCSESMAGTVEKGIDTAIVTDLLTLAWEGAWQVAVLVSADRDFVPAVELLSTKGYRVVNACFPPRGMDLARSCWGSIDLRKAVGVLGRP